MHDIKFVRKSPELFDEAMRKRGENISAQNLLEMDEKRRMCITRIQELQHARKQLAQEIGKEKSQGKDADDLQEKARKLNDQITELQAIDHDAVVREILEVLPNMPQEDVPYGQDEQGNQEVRQWGTIPQFSFEAKAHDTLGEAMGFIDFNQAAAISGARFSVLKGPLARLERALAQFMLDIHTQEFGYTEISPPCLTLPGAMYGVGQLPKFEEESYITQDGYRLIPTAEVPLTNLVAGKILEEAELPIRFTAFTPCFRREAGAAGKDTRGLMRQHQFSKVELVSITSATESKQEHERMTHIAEEVLKRLGLPYRVMLLCTGDMGFASQKTYDLEVWIPSQNKYREISSCSNCGPFQARRMGTRYRPEGQKENEFVHTLNGSALAIGRTIIAIMENYQQGNGTFHVPDALHPYMGGTKVIGA